MEKINRLISQNTCKNTPYFNCLFSSSNRDNGSARRRANNEEQDDDDDEDEFERDEECEGEGLSLEDLIITQKQKSQEEDDFSPKEDPFEQVVEEILGKMAADGFQEPLIKEPVRDDPLYYPNNYWRLPTEQDQDMLDKLLNDYI